MKTSLDIPDELLKRVMQFTGAKTKKEAVSTALEFFMQVQEMRSLSKSLRGSFKTIVSNDQLTNLRQD